MRKNIILSLLMLLAVFVKAQSTADYIDEHVVHAQDLMREHEIPASIILAVAIHESAAGNSKIAKHLNNHFGIKGKNSNTQIKSAYRDYPTVDSSYNHFIDFLHSRKQFDALFEKHNQYDYKNWAAGIQRGGYARSRTWATQVIALINKYQLYEYDERPEDYVEIVAPVVAIEKKLSTNKSTTKKSNIYIVKKGDNLNKIANRFSTTASKLMKINGLTSALLQPSQKIRLK